MAGYLGCAGDADALEYAVRLFLDIEQDAALAEKAWSYIDAL